MQLHAWDGWATYRCRIEKRTRRNKTQFRYVIERKFVIRCDYKVGRWSSKNEKVLEKARKEMKRLDTAGIKYEHIYL